MWKYIMNKHYKEVSMSPAIPITDLSYKGKSAVGVLMSHGYTSTPESLRFVAEHLSRQGWHVEVPLLPGHGTHWREMNQCVYPEWLSTLRSAQKRLADRGVQHIFVMGLSMGGALALRLAEEDASFAGVILVNHMYRLKPYEEIGVRLLQRWVPAVWKTGSDIKDPNGVEIAYNCSPLKALAQALDLCQMMRVHMHQITAPVCIFKSLEDHVLPVAPVLDTVEALCNTTVQLEWLHNSYHVATQDLDAEHIAERTTTFIRQCLR